MITTQDYFGKWYDHPDATPERKAAADVMLALVNDLLTEAEAHGVDLIDNPHTSCLVSGEVYGGFRPKDCPIGAAQSAHKEGRAVDVFDPHGALDKWLTDARLEAHGLYRESPSKTQGWAHISDRAPPSGRRTFDP